MAIFSHRTLPKKLSASLLSLEIPRDRYIQKIMLRVKVTNTHTTATGPNENGVLNFIKNIQLLGNSPKVKDQVVQVCGYDAWVIDAYEHGTPAKNDAPATGTLYGEITFNFQTDAKNPLDMSALINSRDFSNLDLVVTPGVIADLYDSVGDAVLNSWEITVTLREADLSAADLAVVGNMLVVKETTKTVVVDSISSAYQFYTNLPTSTILKRITAIVNNTASPSIRSDSVLTDTMIKQEATPKNELLQSEWYTQQLDNKQTYGVASVIRGVTIWNLRDSNLLNATALKQGDITWKANSAALGTVRLVIQEVY